MFEQLLIHFVCWQRIDKILPGVLGQSTNCSEKNSVIKLLKFRMYSKKRSVKLKEIQEVVKKCSVVDEIPGIIKKVVSLKVQLV